MIELGMQSVCEVARLGVVPYQKAWKLQEHLARQIAENRRRPVLLLLEHPHTYTFGKRGHRENLLWDEAELARRGVDIHWVDRGGDITYHGPGQLVGYPLLHLAPINAPASQGDARSPRIPQADYVGYVRNLEQALILALSMLGITGGQIAGRTGVWVQPHVPSRYFGCPLEPRRSLAKIAAIGVKVDVRGITRHGFALNVSPDMSFWDGMIGCGLKDARAASFLDFMDPPIPMQRVMDHVVDAFGSVFLYDMMEVDAAHLLDKEAAQIEDE
jgi:lipoyl(octanoyl) transferase